VELDLDWDLPLEHRIGSAKRLGGIDVYYEFEWRALFGDQRVQFRNGQCLAQQVRACCPEGKTPALLLTNRDHVEEGYRSTKLYHICVINLVKYRKVSPDASSSYWAGRLGPGITQLSNLPELLARATPEQVSALIRSRLTIEHISEWASSNGHRIPQLRELIQVDVPGEPATASEIVAAVQALGGLDADTVAALATLVGPGTNRQHRIEFVRHVTADPIGRYLTVEVLAERTSERVADARNVVANYNALLDAPGSIETTMQSFIEDNPWLVGLDYAKIRPRQRLLQGVADFFLERFDGFHDLLELKSPHDPIIKVDSPDDGGPAPPASEYALSPDLAQALAQVHAYRALLTHHPAATEDIVGLQGTRDPRLMIVIGNTARLGEHSKRVLTELNKSLHRVEVVPYDVLGMRASAILDNVERYLLDAT
jgi:hypothetical protein